MTPEQIERIKAKTRAEWRAIKEEQAWFADAAAVRARSWVPPPLTPQQKQEQDDYIRKFNLPF